MMPGPGFAAGLANGLTFGLTQAEKRQADMYERYIRERQLSQQESQFTRQLDSSKEEAKLGREHQANLQTQRIDFDRNEGKLGREHQAGLQDDRIAFEGQQGLQNRQLQRDMQHSGQLFQSGQQKAAQTFQAGQAAADRKQQFAIARMSDNRAAAGQALQGRGLDLQARALDQEKTHQAVMDGIAKASAKFANQEQTAQTMARYWQLAQEQATTTATDPHGRPLIDRITNKPHVTIDTALAITKFDAFLSKQMGMPRSEIDDIMQGLKEQQPASASVSPAVSPKDWQPGVRVGQPGRTY